MSWLSQGVHAIGNVLTGHHDTPDPRKFSSPQTTVPPTNSAITTAPPPGGSSGPSIPTSNQYGAMTPQEQTFMNAAMANPDLVGVLQGLGSGAWDKIKSILPKNDDGSINWGAVGTDVVKWVKDNKDTILSVASAYNGYQRQQQSDAYAKKGLQLATDEYNDPAGKGALRASGVAGMLDPNAKTPDLSSLQRLAGPQSGNPFASAIPLAPLNNHTPPTGALPLAQPPEGTPPVIGGTEPPLKGIAGLPLAGGPMPGNGQQTGTPPTIPAGMQPPAGWTPPKAAPKALPLATPTIDPNKPLLPYAS